MNFPVGRNAVQPLPCHCHESESTDLDERLPVGSEGRMIFDLIRELHENMKMTVLLVSHSMEDVANYVDRIIVLNHGSLMLDGTPAEVFSHVEELERVSLAVPQVTYLMKDLKKAGLDVNTSVTTIEEAKKEIMKLC